MLRQVRELPALDADDDSLLGAEAAVPLNDVVPLPLWSATAGESGRVRGEAVDGVGDEPVQAQAEQPARG
jgi:hypothetical protein